jgi:ribosomal protein S18 acetylase RimI-like enzyme
LSRICLHDRSAIADYLVQESALNLYLIGDLADFFWSDTLWYGWQEAGQLKAVALVYTGDKIPVLLLMEDTPWAHQLLTSLTSVLPHRFYAHLRPGLASALPFSGEGGDTYIRMVQKTSIDPKELMGVAKRHPHVRAEVLHPEDQKRVEQFYAKHYPQNWFNPRMLATGTYIALTETNAAEETALVAIAGIHVLSEAQGIAALGNIAVHQSYQGLGLGQWVTGVLCQHLQDQYGIHTLGLNVHCDNAKAQSCYKRLGFESVATYQEWTFVQD